MSAPPPRVTGPFVEILELFMRAWQEGDELHGWRIMRDARLSGPTVYRILDQLEDCGWIRGDWNEQDRRAGRPRIRLYRLTTSGVPAARNLLTEQAEVAKLRPRSHLAGPRHAGRTVAWVTVG